MKLIVCVDERSGMIFNKRRQSSDGAQIEDMKRLISGEPLAVSPYSAKLLSDSGIELLVTDNPSVHNGYCFIENTELPDSDKIDTVVVYNWCRHYPADRRFELDLSIFKLSESTEFVGTAHGKIKREIYRK